MSKLSSWRTICFLCAFCAAISIASAVGTFRTLVSFDGPDGEVPSGSLVQGIDGNFYGTTGGGGANRDGVVFEISAGGKLTTLHSFDGTEGCCPHVGLVQAADGNFYGTAYGGGVNHIGSVFKVTAGGKLTTLHSFDGTDGANPNAALVQASDGNFYGTTGDGGASGYGTVFKITPAGILTTLHNFEGTDGQFRERRVGSSHQRELLRDNHRWRDRQRLHGWQLRYGVRNHRWGQADHAAQLQGHGRRQPLCRAGSGRQWKLLRDNFERRDQRRLLWRLWHGVRNHRRRQANHAPHLRRE